MKAPQNAPLPLEGAGLYERLLNAYFSIQRTLAYDQMEGVAASADTFRKQLEVILGYDVKPATEADAYHKRIQALQASAAKFQPKDVEEARMQFGQLSADFIALLTQLPPGEAMISCGEVVDTVEAEK
jgi:hypothetical protein